MHLILDGDCAICFAVLGSAYMHFLGVAALDSIQLHFFRFFLLSLMYPDGKA